MFFDGHGLLAGTTHICKSCYKQLPKQKKTKKTKECFVETEEDAEGIAFVETEEDAEGIAFCIQHNLFEQFAETDRSSSSMEIDFCAEDTERVSVLEGDKEAESTSSAIKVEEEPPETDFSFVPKESLLFGMWTGSIPVELMGLTVIEVSMISMYSCLTKISLQGGKHYRTKGATSFTVINDVTKIYNQLPVMPTAESTGILRAKNSSCSKDYTYRPNKVFYALKWLKENNHLYKDLPDFNFPTLNVPLDSDGNAVLWENCSTAIEPEVFELTEEDILEIDENYGSDELPDASTNTGFSIFYNTIKVIHKIEVIKK